jgi:beta-lactamase superfamily II metal-dependent hydrolase
MPSSVLRMTFTEGNSNGRQNSRFTVLHRSHRPSRSSPDRGFKSTGVQVDLGAGGLFLTGGATNGKRENHDTLPTGAEKGLLDHHAQNIYVDVLRVAHHESKTAARSAWRCRRGWP